jgi:hypothetical protein
MPRPATNGLCRTVDFLIDALPLSDVNGALGRRQVDALEVFVDLGQADGVVVCPGWIDMRDALAPSSMRCRFIDC